MTFLWGAAAALIARTSCAIIYDVWQRHRRKIVLIQQTIERAKSGQLP